MRIRRSSFAPRPRRHVLPPISKDAFSMLMDANPKPRPAVIPDHPTFLHPARRPWEGVDYYVKELKEKAALNLAGSFKGDLSQVTSIDVAEAFKAIGELEVLNASFQDKESGMVKVRFCHQEEPIVIDISEITALAQIVLD